MTKTIRFLHTSDIHLGSDSHIYPQSDSAARNWLKSIIDVVNEVEADFLIVAGDLFDSPRVSDTVVEFAEEQFARATIPVILLPGNHDCLVDGSPYLRDNAFGTASNVRVINDPAGERISLPELDQVIWGRPHVDYSDYAPLEDIAGRGPERWQIGVAHGYYTSEDYTMNRGWQITDEDLENSHMDYIALGHVETFSKAGRDGVTAYYSGSPQRTGAAVMVELNPSTGVHVRQLNIPHV